MIKPSKEGVLQFLKTVIKIAKPANLEAFDNVFIDQEIIKTILEDNVAKGFKIKSVLHWMSNDSFFGKTIRKGAKHGRWCYVLQKKYRCRSLTYF